MRSGERKGSVRTSGARRGRRRSRISLGSFVLNWLPPILTAAGVIGTSLGEDRFFVVLAVGVLMLMLRWTL